MKVGGDVQLAIDVIEIFKAEAPQLIRRLESSLDARDARDAASHAHTVKGASANVGGELLSDFARQIEAAAKGDDLAGAGELLGDLRDHYDALQVALDALARELKSADLDAA